MKKRKIKAHREIVWARANKAAMQQLTEYEREHYVTHHKNKTHGLRLRAESYIEHRLYKMGVLIPDKSSIYYVWFPWQFTRTRQSLKIDLLKNKKE